MNAVREVRSVFSNLKSVKISEKLEISKYLEWFADFDVEFARDFSTDHDTKIAFRVSLG